jgi:signal transduction histidine kinase
MTTTSTKQQGGIGKSRRILVIDDEPRLARSLGSLLRGSGYQVAVADSGHAGLEALKGDAFDLVITDLRMDGVDGFDIMQHTASYCPQTALIVITGHASTESAIEALHQRAADYITKPFEFDFLKASIEKVFARQEADQLRRDLVSMLSHDIKVPLSSILGFARLIVQRDGTLSPRAADCAEYVVTNSQRILAMLDNYLTNSRLEEGRLETLPLSVVPEELVSEAMLLFELEYRRKELRLALTHEPVGVVIEADEPLLLRAVSNLLANAAKYAPPGTQVQLSTSVRGGVFSLTVVNESADQDGEAMDLFERYRRNSRSARGIEGSGLGLHIVRCVAEAHGGSARAWIEGGLIYFELRIPQHSREVRS